VRGILAAAAISFAAAAFILMQVLPAPRTRIDYMVIGTVATFVSLLVLFVLFSRGGGKDLLVRRRK